MAEHLHPGAPFIAETGGLNAMIVDSTALPEQAVTAIVESAFQSAGQRCSALRCLYVQEDIATPILDMLKGAMKELSLGDPWEFSTDCGPVIDKAAQSTIAEHIEQAQKAGDILFQLSTPQTGTFIAPTLIRINGIADLGREIFGPVLHVATFKARELDQVIDAINATGYGLTFGLQTRIDDRVQHVSDRIEAGNIYVNRNQIGAAVGSQPFGGEGLSGTGPKAGGSLYLARFSKPIPQTGGLWSSVMPPQALQDLIEKAVPAGGAKTTSLPGPTGESNRLTHSSRAPVLCLGPGSQAAQQQADLVTGLGGTAVKASGAITAHTLETLDGFSAAIWWATTEDDRAHAREIVQSLSRREGPILPLISGAPDASHVLNERHVCVDTTAAGGNATLLSGGA